MTDRNCLQDFIQTSRDNEFARNVDRISPDCGCEAHTVSIHCEEPVGDEEVLVRLVMDPIHIHRDSGGTRLQSSFLNVVSTAGASCLRYGRASSGEYQETARLIVSHNPRTPDGRTRKVYGVVKIPVTAIREEHVIVDDKTKQSSIRALCIYATGEPGRPNHADIVANGLSRHNLSRAKQNRVAENVSKKFARDIITVEHFKDTADLAAWA